MPSHINIKPKGLIEDIYNVYNKQAEEKMCFRCLYPIFAVFWICFQFRFLPIDNPKFTFIDLFAGIGGVQNGNAKSWWKMCVLFRMGCTGSKKHIC